MKLLTEEEVKNLEIYTRFIKNISQTLSPHDEASSEQVRMLRKCRNEFTRVRDKLMDMDAPKVGHGYEEWNKLVFELDEMMEVCTLLIGALTN